MKHWLFLTLTAMLCACSSKPVSYLPSGTTPIVNMEAPLNEQISLTTAPLLLKAQNLTETPLNIGYKLFWYDKEGVTQTGDTVEPAPWHNFSLEPRSKTEIPLVKPTAESVNYRVYLRANP